MVYEQGLEENPKDEVNNSTSLRRCSQGSSSGESRETLI